MVQRYGTNNFTLSDIQMQGRNLAHGGPRPAYDKAQSMDRVLAEAWQWLTNEGLIMVAVDQPNGFFCITRKGASLKSQGDVQTYAHGNLLPVALLNPLIAEKVRPMFLRGDYDVAVFQAFKEVEVAVRRASGLPKEMIGVKLMRAAFSPENGPLTDKEAEGGERTAMMELYAGAIGHCKNPTSHRDVAIDRATAARLIALASHLLEQVSD
jgi:uncharacterized protein (TIGR02391 family)